MIGLKRGSVALYPHEKEWDDEAKRTIEILKGILGDTAVDVQHVGSTAVAAISAKPIIDVAAGVRSFDELLTKQAELENNGFYFRESRTDNQLLLACGSFYDGTGDEQTHFIHVVIYGGSEWQNYLLVRDYLNENLAAAKEYEALKFKLIEECSAESGREQYTEGKERFINQLIRTALIEKYMGTTVKIGIDRPIGYVHEKEKYTLVYTINYGYIPGVFGGDGEELDVYLLGVDEPVDEYFCEIIGVALRKNDCEDKLIAAPIGKRFTAEEARAAIDFQEKWYDTEVQIVN